ncbi:FAD-dependent oxidoreductase [Longimicrobium sp.]|uniref:FAD-dependent oxidoreductase n=1 Tax=Longimicrobium sp. TaxID=2029185 RepID=UPI002C5FD37A|nr:FAD-dependent oxidoreductase [Longimicrobium sp.]HSU17426.1 FAD-dependent oxidoreductase [Longimicrobium sp.]
MGGEKQELEGPDLMQGVPLDDIGDGGILTGHANGEPVVVVRTGGEVFALDANCTHYGVPLGGGVVVDGTIRCPAHHSRFDLRTGEAVAAPALRPAGCWNAEVREGRVFVTGRRDAQPKAPAVDAPAEMPRSIVIVGAGAAGSACAEMLRREGFAGAVTMIDATADGPVDRPNLSKDYLAGNAPEEWIPLFPPEWYAENRIDLVLGTRVVGIDAAERRVKLMNGRTCGYDALLIATGSEPVRLPVSQREVPHLFYLRSLADSRAIIRAAESAKKAVVVGSSFIGLEVAASLRARGLEVNVVSHEPLPLGNILGPELGWNIQRLHQDHGVKFHLKDGVQAIDGKTVTLKSGPSLEADLVVVGIGVRPGIALGQWAGLKVEGGIVVDEFLRTSAPGIWAAGDVCRWPDAWTGQNIRSEHWVVGQRQGQTAARNMLGRREAFRAAPFFWSTHYDVTISYVGHAEKWDAIEIDGDPRANDCTAVYRKGGKPLAIATIARDRTSLCAEAGIEAADLAAVEAAIRGDARAAAGVG